MDKEEQPFTAFSNPSNLDEIKVRPTRFFAYSIFFIIIIIVVITLVVLLNNANYVIDDGLQILTLKFNITNNATKTKIIELSLDDTLIINSMKIDNNLENYSNYFLFNSTGTHSVEIKFNNSISSLKELFIDCIDLIEVDLSDLEIINITSSTKMFYNCSKLKKINFGNNFRTDNIMNMDGMFYGCNSLTSIYLSQKFITKNVISMSKMFSDCNSLTSIDVTKFDTTKVEDMSEMFCNCGKLKKIDLEKFKTESVTNMSKMFSGCKSITSLNLANFNTENLENVNYMFADCELLDYLDLSRFNLSKVNDLEGTFNNIYTEGKIIINEALFNKTLPEIFDNWEVIYK